MGNTEKMINPKLHIKELSLSDQCSISWSFISQHHLKITKSDQCLCCYHVVKMTST